MLLSPGPSGARIIVPDEVWRDCKVVGRELDAPRLNERVLRVAP